MKNNVLMPAAMLALMLSAATIQSCNSGQSPAAASTNDSSKTVSETQDVIPSHFLTRELQAQLTPDSALSLLKNRNREYVDGGLTIRNTSDRIRKASLGQFPAAAVLSCLDSRVPVEDVFHSGIGDLFVARVAGNISNEDILGSLEFACRVSGARLIVVLGHEHCGAIKSAIDSVQLGNITGLLNKIRQAATGIKDFQGDRTSANAAYVEAVAKQNIRATIDSIRQQSPILKEMEEKGAIKIVGAEYHMETGAVEFL